ncbi:MAG: sulfotransferase family 2 domain-containing protein [Hyphomicrobiales bacterium]
MGAMLAQGLGGAALGEVFHCGLPAVDPGQLHLAQGALFSAFLETEARSNPAVVPKMIEAPGSVLDHYFGQLVSAYGHDHTILVKYNSLMAFNTGWRRCGELSSEILDGLARNGYRIVHLRRRNKLASVVSEIVAFRTGRWHQSNDVEPGTLAPRIQISPVECSQRLQQAVTEEAAAMRLLSPFRPIEIVYESDILPDGAAAACARVLGAAPEAVSPKPGDLKRMPRVIVENVDEIYQHCRPDCLPEDLEELAQRYGPLQRSRDMSEQNLPRMTSLKAGDFDAYRRRQAGKPLSVVFVHVPKTAGSTIVSTFESSGIELLRVEIDYSNPAEVADYHGAMQHRLSDAVAKPVGQNGQFLTGHYFTQNLLTAIGSLDGRLLFTMLRDPVTRIISEYQYCCSSRHPPHEQFRAQFPSFTDYLKHPSAQEQFFEFLRPSLKASVDETIAFLEANFVLVGIQEEFKLSMELLQLATGVNCVTDEHDNALHSSQEGKREELLSYRPQIEAANPIDMTIYGWFSEILKGLRKPFETWKRDDLRRGITNGNPRHGPPHGET